jgi:Flp pilus assembly protein TadG
VRWIAQPRRIGKRPGESGQGAVEFALVGGLFFFLVFSLVNAGFFLYGRTAVQHAADVGMAAISAEGRCTASGGPCLAIASNCPNYQGGAMQNNADEVAICLMDQAGLTTTPLTTVTSIQVWQVEQNADGTPNDSCNNTGSGTGSLPCNTANENTYDVYGNASIHGWPVTSRDVSTSGSSFARLIIYYRYSLAATNQTFAVSTSNVFRLEPQQ